MTECCIFLLFNLGTCQIRVSTSVHLLTDFLVGHFSKNLHPTSSRKGVCPPYGWEVGGDFPIFFQNLLSHWAVASWEDQPGLDLFQSLWQPLGINDF
jgi:hypothetical protein